MNVRATCLSLDDYLSHPDRSAHFQLGANFSFHSDICAVYSDRKCTWLMPDSYYQ